MAGACTYRADHRNPVSSVYKVFMSHSRRAHILNNTLLGADRRAVLERVLREVDLWHWRLRRHLRDRALYFLLFCGRHRVQAVRKTVGRS